MDRQEFKKDLSKLPGLNDKEVARFADSLDYIASLMGKALESTDRDVVGIGMGVQIDGENSRVKFKIAAMPKSCPRCSEDCDDEHEDGHDEEAETEYGTGYRLVL